jgi:hypothetical protein
MPNQTITADQPADFEALKAQVRRSKAALDKARGTLDQAWDAARQASHECRDAEQALFRAREPELTEFLRVSAEIIDALEALRLVIYRCQPAGE